MYAPEQNVEAPPIVEALRFTFQQYLRMRGSSRSDNYQMTPPQQQQPPQPNNRNCLRQFPHQHNMLNNSPLNNLNS